MNKDQVKGAAKDIAGKIQEDSGKLVGSRGPRRVRLKSPRVKPQAARPIMTKTTVDMLALFLRVNV
jgi:hypothetical protein